MIRLHLSAFDTLRPTVVSKCACRERSGRNSAVKYALHTCKHHACSCNIHIDIAWQHWSTFSSSFRRELFDHIPCDRGNRRLAEQCRGPGDGAGTEAASTCSNTFQFSFSRDCLEPFVWLGPVLANDLLSETLRKWRQKGVFSTPLAVS